VDQGGLIRGIDKGQTWVIAAFENRNDSVLVNVVEDPTAIALLEVKAATNMVAIGESVQLMAIVKNSQGDDILEYMEMWMNSNQNAASLSSEGLLTGLAPGITSVVVKVDEITSPPFQFIIGNLGRTGEFEGQNGYTASGTVTIIENAGENQVRLEENFTTQSGPGLHVYLATNELSASGGVDLGELQANSGIQSYNIPDAVDADDYSHVLIYCKPFGVVFASAELN
jgi:hypothetical protein